MRAVMFLLNVYQGKVDPGFVPSLLPHMLGAVTLRGEAKRWLMTRLQAVKQCSMLQVQCSGDSSQA